MSILDTILATTRESVARRKAQTPASKLIGAIGTAGIKHSFSDTLRSASRHPALIAEIKHRSPSAGAFVSRIPLEVRINAYESGGASAISYVSEHEHFGGSLDELRKVVQHASVPVLQKDFVVDTYQILEAAAHGVSALLLIARILEPAVLRTFIVTAQAYGIEPVVEVYDEADLEKALATSPGVIGVNARNLDTFTVNIAAAGALLRQIPNDILRIGFSGVNDRSHVEQYAAAGASAVLVGSALMQSDDPAPLLKKL
ncbi:MAG: indole-3-glycerol phosphate synthase TrpC [Patescibacteria group bacterium]|nr:indole-3-glycerol phosphate synthase TrpC [Patescibacteria group bacterium]